MIFFSIFVFRNSKTQSYHSPGIRRNTRKNEIYKYNRQHNHQSAYSQWDSHMHFSFTCSQCGALGSLVQADIWAHRGAKPRPKFSVSCGGWEGWGALECRMHQSRESRGGRAGRRSWLCGSCPSCSRAGEKWVMSLQNLTVDWHGGSPAFWLQGRMDFPHIWVKAWGVHGQADTLSSPSASDSPALPLQPPLSVWGSSHLLRGWQSVPCWWFNELWD